MLKCVYVAMKNNVVFDVSLIDYDAQVMNRKHKQLVKKRVVVDFTTQHFAVAGNNLSIKAFKRLVGLKNTNDSLKYLVCEIENECK